MKDFYKKVREEIEKNNAVVVCSIIASSGSSPRGEGAKMAVFSDGTTYGTIGGGAVELNCINESIKALKEEKSFILGYNLNKNEVNDIGMICGGAVEVYFEYISPKNVSLTSMYKELSDLLNESYDLWLIKAIENDFIVSTGFYTAQGGLKYLDTSYFDIVLKNIKNKAVFLKDNSPKIYIEPLSTTSIVYIFGGGHVGRALAPVLSNIDFRVVVFDNRELVAKEGIVGAEKVILGDYSDIFSRLTINKSDYIVIMTPGHEGDFQVLDQALRTEANYIGCIGSRHKIAQTQKRLMERGHTMENISRIHSPIGLEILAETPQEIAISVAGELIKHRASLS